MNKPTLCFDFDGVIHSYKSGWRGDSIIPDPPVDGMREAINTLKSQYKIVINSARCKSPEGYDAIKRWLDKNDIYYDEVSMIKPQAMCYIDDRAICFDGNPNHMMDAISAFQPWYKK